MNNNKKNKILLIGYGGTITMVVKNNIVQPLGDVKEILEMVPRINDIADIDMKILSNVDSTNVVPDDWTIMSEFIINNRENYDGFIISHGINTMSYSAAAVSLALGKDFGKTVIFTGAQIPITTWGSDGIFNLENSVRTINESISKGINEIMVVFSDLIMRASRVVKVSESDFRAFDTPFYEKLGQIKPNSIYFSETILPKDKKEYKENYSSISTKFGSGVVTIDSTPGQDPMLIRYLLNNQFCKGVIFKSNGSNSLPSIGKYSFLPLIEEASKNLNIPVLISTKYVGGQGYENINDKPAMLAEESGAILINGLTSVMSEVKLMWLIARGITSIEEVKKEMGKDYIGEVSI